MKLKKAVKNPSGETDLLALPGVGAVMKKHLLALGYTTAEQLAGQDPADLYLRDCLRCGYQLNRCMLYVYRGAVYFAETEHPEPEKLKWWYWQDAN